MKKLSFCEWLNQTEEVIAAAFAEILPRDWDENDATKSWMRALRRELRSVEVTDLGRPYAMEWDAVKLKGTGENLYGDIGVLVRIDYPNGVQADGIGFIEAKRIYASGRYQELKFDQLERMLKGTPYHRLGLYEQAPIAEAAFGLAGHGVASALNPSRENQAPWDKVVAAVVPTNVALKMKGNRRPDLHPPSLPLSYQLCARYLSGYDLDYGPKLIETVVKGGAGSPSWLLIAHTAIGGDTTPSTESFLPIEPGSPYTSLEPDQQVATDLHLESKESEQDEQQQELTVTYQTPTETQTRQSK